MINTDKKTCIGCQTEKHKSHFNIQKVNPDGLNKHCNECIAAGNRHKKPRKAVSYRKNRDYNLKKLFGITSDGFDKILESQGGCCLICGDENPPPVRKEQMNGFVVDHCHDTGIIRGILCQSCNKALGFLRDDPNTAERAYKYLFKWMRVTPNEY